MVRTDNDMGCMVKGVDSIDERDGLIVFLDAKNKVLAAFSLSKIVCYTLEKD